MKESPILGVGLAFALAGLVVGFAAGESHQHSLDLIEHPVELLHILTTDEVVAALNECASRVEKLEAHWDKNAYGDILSYQCQPSEDITALSTKELFTKP